MEPKDFRVGESPEYVRMSLAAAITLGLRSGSFFRGAELYCLNLLLTYNDGCAGKCAYCGLSRSRISRSEWNERSFIRVDWPLFPLSEVVRRVADGVCPHVERACVSMVTHRRAKEDTLKVVESVRSVIEEVSALISPTIISKDWLWSLKNAGVDKVGVAVDAATPELFERLRGRGVGGPHRWEKYWKTVEESVDVFGEFNVGVHLIVGLGETEEEMTHAIQAAYDMGALTHLFSFFPEEGSLLESKPQPPIGSYRRVQLARYLINKGLASCEDMEFDREGRIVGFGVPESVYKEAVESGLPFMTSGCSSRNRENACNRPFSDFTPYQAYIGEMRNYPFKPGRGDIELVKRQLKDYSNTPVKVWIEEVKVADE